MCYKLLLYINVWYMYVHIFMKTRVIDLFKSNCRAWASIQTKVPEICSCGRLWKDRTAFQIGKEELRSLNRLKSPKFWRVKTPKKKNFETSPHFAVQKIPLVYVYRLFIRWLVNIHIYIYNFVFPLYLGDFQHFMGSSDFQSGGALKSCPFTAAKWQATSPGLSRVGSWARRKPSCVNSKWCLWWFIGTPYHPFGTLFEGPGIDHGVSHVSSWTRKTSIVHLSC